MTQTIEKQPVLDGSATPQWLFGCDRLSDATGPATFKVASLNARSLRLMAGTISQYEPPQGGRRRTSPTTVSRPMTEIPQAVLLNGPRFTA